MRTVARLVTSLTLMCALLVGTVVAVAPLTVDLRAAQQFENPEVDLAALDDYAIRSHVYSRDGSLLTTLHGPENRQPVALEEVPDEVVLAILAVEDADFYHHRGVNLRATARALLENVAEGGIVQGGSTITQQLVKNALLTSDQELDRKTREAALALRLEEQLSKDEILELYLNTVYFGAGAYGVQAAAETYWNRSVGRLGWAEGAMLAALIANPTGSDPTLYPENARRQRSIAIDRLVVAGHLTSEEAEEVARVPLPLGRCGPGVPPTECPDGDERWLETHDSYFVEDVKQQLLNDPRYGLGDTAIDRFNALFSGGISVHTTLDTGAQFVAEVVADEVVPDNEDGVTAAMVAVENDTGAVRAMVGGPGFEEFKFNIATQQPGLQTGSAFKTFVLLAALEQGAIPTDNVDGGGDFDNPGGDPDPYRISGRGGTLTSITASSSNGAFVRLGQIVGLDAVAEVAERLGLRTNFEGLPISMPLGTLDTTPVDMASAYSAIANGGIHEPWYLIERVESATGEILYEHRPSPRRVLTADTACMATEALEAVVRSGTGTRARLDRQPAAGKTGTTDQHQDAWFVGYTPYLTTAVWLGKPLDPDDPDDARVDLRNLGGIANFGGNYPAMVWRDFNEAYHAAFEEGTFEDCERTRGSRQLTERGIAASIGRSGTTGSSSGSGSGSSSGTPRSTTTTTAPPRSTSTTTTPATTVAPPPTDPPPTTAAPPPPPTDPPPPEPSVPPTVAGEG
ncbi:MAG: transglycosylase domain-containing protein [Acidimicrobiia bacterium]|nr:transglycosylase domain-containing protein [Acidimicrobiia bacterium]